MITIVDYGAGNLRSVVNAITRLGYQPKITSNPNEVLSAQVVILPGVGAAADTIQNLKALDMVEPIRQFIAEGRPFFGVCIGLQILLTSTEEGGWHECLNVFPGRVTKLLSGLKIPHMGWNQVKQRGFHLVFAGIPDEANFYFVHSYYVEPDDKSLVAGETEYDIPFCSIVTRGNLVGTQFHPGKVGSSGSKCTITSREWHRKSDMLTKRIIPCLDVKEEKGVKWQAEAEREVHTQPCSQNPLETVKCFSEVITTDNY